MKLYSVHLYLYVIYPQRTRNFRASTAKIGIRSCPPKISNKANRATYVPYFYSKDGYAALGHSNVTHFNRMAARSLVRSPVGREVLLTWKCVEELMENSHPTTPLMMQGLQGPCFPNDFRRCLSFCHLGITGDSDSGTPLACDLSVHMYARRYHSTGQQLAWAFEGAFQLFLMPAASLAEGTSVQILGWNKAAQQERRLLWFGLFLFKRFQGFS